MVLYLGVLLKTMEARLWFHLFAGMVGGLELLTQVGLRSGCGSSCRFSCANLLKQRCSPVPGFSGQHGIPKSKADASKVTLVSANVCQVKFHVARDSTAV